MFEVTLETKHWERARDNYNPFAPDYCSNCALSEALKDIADGQEVLVVEDYIRIGETRYYPVSLALYCKMLLSFDLCPEKIPGNLPVTLQFEKE